MLLYVRNYNTIKESLDYETVFNIIVDIVKFSSSFEFSLDSIIFEYLDRKE